MLEVIERKLRNRPDIMDKTKFTVEDVVETLGIIFQTTYIEEKKEYYHQIKGIPQGSKISTHLCDIILSEIDDEIMNSYAGQLKLYVRFVDDSLLACQEKYMLGMQAYLNTIYPWLGYTLEKQNENRSLNFLDLTLTINNKNEIDYSHYIKPMQTNRTVSYDSYQDRQYLISTLKGEIIRTVRNTKKEDELTDKLNYIKRKYLKANYPSQLINRLANEYWAKKQINKTKFQVKDNKLFIPYYPNIMDRLHQLGQNNNFQVIARKDKTLKQMLQRKNKNSATDKFEERNVVYKVPCESCNKSYIGTTKQKLRERLNKHKSDLKLKNINNSFYQHQINTGHNPKFADTSILYKENQYKSRMNIETITIIKNKDRVINHIIPENSTLENWVKFL